MVVFLLFAHLYIDISIGNNQVELFYYRKAVDYMIRNYMNDIKIEDISKYVGIDRTYLYRIFISIDSISPKQFLTNLRMKVAMQMLNLEKYSVTEIAYYTGFRDSAAFCNAFKKHTSMTPKQYKKTSI